MAVDPRSLRLYVVTSSGLVPGRGHRDVAFAAIAGGATAVQLRAPELGRANLLEVAEELASWCRDAGVLFVVNDRVDVAAAVGAGAHVGQRDDPHAARTLLGAGRPLGISVASVEEALAARADRADYLGLTVWTTSTKPEAAPRGIHGLRAVVDATPLPVVAIGGIDAGNAREVLDAGGASGVAVISAVGAAPDPVAATRELAEVVGVSRMGER
ncbi:MAG: thiamine phosphate synthase [Actinomycetota bacterium]